MKKQIWSVVVVCAVLSGCASGVKLDDVPVEDRAATSSRAGSGSGSGVAVQGIGTGQGGAQTGMPTVNCLITTPSMRERPISQSLDFSKTSNNGDYWTQR
jgi:hypothetical protein